MDSSSWPMARRCRGVQVDLVRALAVHQAAARCGLAVLAQEVPVQVHRARVDRAQVRQQPVDRAQADRVVPAVAHRVPADLAAAPPWAMTARR